MKKILIITIVSLIGTVGFAQNVDKKKPAYPVVISGPDIRFDTASHDFGKITEGTQAKYLFKFTNTGKADLLISNVSTPCGCTTPSYSKEPIQPGKSGEIAINFNSTGKNGHFSKTCIVTTNADNHNTNITISGVVVPKPAENNNTGK